VLLFGFFYKSIVGPMQVTLYTIITGMFPHYAFAVLIALSPLLSPPSLSIGAELLPYTPPSAQQRPTVRPHDKQPALTPEQQKSIRDLSKKAKTLSKQDKKRLMDIIRSNLDSARKGKNWAQVEYYSEALDQLD